MRACGCVHERGPGATHTHTHTLTRPHPRRALGRAAGASPDLHPKVRSSRVPRPVPSPCGWLPTNAAGRIRRPGQGATAGSPHHPAAAVPALRRPPRGRGWGEGARGSYRSGGRVRAGAPGGSRPATSARPAGTRPEGGPGGGHAGGRPSCPAPPPARGEPRPACGRRWSPSGGARILPGKLGFSRSVPAGRAGGRHPDLGQASGLPAPVSCL